MKNEGYIKFNLDWDQKKFNFIDHNFETVNSFRDKLYTLGLIGAYPDGIGFGNLSIRNVNDEFIISGSATGNFKILSKDQYALVTGFNIKKNSLKCVGLIEASSESLSHGAIYKANKNVNAVIHIHHMALWQKYLNDLPTTPKNAEFGTPDIAKEISKHVNQDSGIIIMGGHPEGVISFGKSLEEAYKILLKYYNTI